MNFTCKEIDHPRGQSSSSVEFILSHFKSESFQGQFKSVASKVRGRKCQGHGTEQVSVSVGHVLFSQTAQFLVDTCFNSQIKIVLGSCVITPHNLHSFVPIIHMKTTRCLNSPVACYGIHSAYMSLCSVWAAQPLHGLHGN